MSSQSAPDQQTPAAPPIGLLLMAAIVPLIFAAVIQPPYFIDDAGFFLRYADHLAAGQGYVFNTGETPIWGATAPLWPVLIAGGKLLGLQAEFALMLVAYVLTSFASICLTWFAWRKGGLLAGVATIVFCVVNTRYLLGTIQGMETPLSYALIAIGLLLLSMRSPAWLVGVVAGLSLVHKIDFAVWGLLLLVADSWRFKKLRWPAVLIACLLAAVWYGFAWSYFGEPWPNSAVTKLGADYASVGRIWFIKVALGDGGRKILFVLALVGVWWLRKESPLLIALLGLVGIYTVTFTLRPPAEAFEWYAGPVQPILIVLAALGVAHLATLFTKSTPSLAFAGVIVVGLLVTLLDWPVLDDRIRWVSYAERDRVEAAKWVCDHSAADARVLTSFGNVACYCDRYVYDSSYLNRRRPASGNEDFLGEFAPEVIVDAYYQTGQEPGEITPPTGYEIARVYDRTREQGGYDFFVVVFLKGFGNTQPLPESMQQRTIAPGP